MGDTNAEHATCLSKTKTLYRESEKKIGISQDLKKGFIQENVLMYIVVFT